MQALIGHLVENVRRRPRLRLPINTGGLLGPFQRLKHYSTILTQLNFLSTAGDNKTLSEFVIVPYTDEMAINLNTQALCGCVLLMFGVVTEVLKPRGHIRVAAQL